MELTKVRRNFQLKIPWALREKLGLAVGDYVEADIEDERIDKLGLSNISDLPH